MTQRVGDILKRASNDMVESDTITMFTKQLDRHLNRQRERRKQLNIGNKMSTQVTAEC